MNIILVGPPGSGKGTQAHLIVKNFNLHKVSSGDLLREEIKNSTDIGKTIKSIIDKGLLVSDDIINILVEKILSKKKFYNRIIFDGYPRNLNQARYLDILAKKTHIFASKGEARRMIQSNAVSINKEKITEDFQLSGNDLLNGKYILSQKGKKNYFLIIVS